MPPCGTTSSSNGNWRNIFKRRYWGSKTYVDMSGLAEYLAEDDLDGIRTK